MAWLCNRGDFMNLVPKKILMSHLKRSEGAEEVSLPIDFFRDLLYQAMPRTWQDLIDEAVKAEREACAKVCEDYGRAEEMQAIGNDYAEAIRARRQA